LNCLGFYILLHFDTHTCKLKFFAKACTYIITVDEMKFKKSPPSSFFRVLLHYTNLFLLSIRNPRKISELFSKHLKQEKSKNLYHSSHYMNIKKNWSLQLFEIINSRKARKFTNCHIYTTLARNILRKCWKKEYNIVQKLTEGNLKHTATRHMKTHEHSYTFTFNIDSFLGCLCKN
jgi:hypothetical protein